MARKIQLENEQGEFVNPLTEPNCVIMDNGQTLEQVMGDGVSMPTISHEDLSFKVGVGDSNVSSSVVDGFVPNMTIKGQTYQNILPEPSLRNSMTNERSMQKFNEGYGSVNVVDGVSKSAILNGNTLVNLMPKTTVSWACTNTGSWLTSYKTLIAETKPSTIYTFFINATSLADSDSILLTIGGKVEASFASKTVTVEKGFNVFTNTTGASGYNYGKAFFQIKNNYNGNVVLDSIMIIEGDHTGKDIPYFTGMQSVKMPVLTTIGKNLFDMSFFVPNQYVDVISLTNNKVVLHGKEVYCKVDIPMQLKPNTKYYTGKKSNKLSSDNASFVFEVRNSTNSNYLVSRGDANVDVSFTTDSTGLVYFRYRVNEVSLSEQIEIFDVYLYEEQSTTYEPYKSNILSCLEDVELRGIGDVRDELHATKTVDNLVENIGEVVFDSSDGFKYIPSQDTGVYSSFAYSLPSRKIIGIALCDKLPRILNYMDNTNGIYYYGSKGDVEIRLDTTNFISRDLVGLNDYLSKNNITLQYELSEKAIKTVDLSSYGNWDKIVLNGNEDTYYSFPAQTNNGTYLYQTPVSHRGSEVDGIYAFCDNPNLSPQTANNLWFGYNGEGVSFGDNGLAGVIQIRIKDASSIDELKQCLSQNPITVWYQTTTSQENSIKEMLSLSNGHIQLSSGVENSLIPSIDYEVPTSNSYHMDLMKTNTVYTMKAESVNGSFNIGTYNGIDLSTNRIFSISQGHEGDKLFVVNGSWTTPMILEGDLTSKILPHFKGIKSAFEDEDKIEVLSLGKNLFDGKFEIGTIDTKGGLYDDGTSIRSTNFNFILPNKDIAIKRFDDNVGVRLAYYDNNKTFISLNNSSSSNYIKQIKSPANASYFKVSLFNTRDITTQAQLEYSSTNGSYEPHKSNDVKIPLLHSLRSLPNGVRDEIVIDNASRKAKLIKRVGKVVLDGSEEWGRNESFSSGMHCACLTRIINMNSSTPTNFKCDKLKVDTLAKIPVDGEGLWGETNANVVYISINASKLIDNSSSSLKLWLQRNPITVYYELATPIIIEIDLEGYPYIYKDGHIFLNSEIVPTTEITYNINQEHQIATNVETLIRHEQKLDNLYDYIHTYLVADYNLELLKLNISLEM